MILALSMVLSIIAYLGSFALFVRSHLTSGIQAGTTKTYLALQDTRLNRTLMKVYEPLIVFSLPAGAPVEWYSP